MTQKLLAEWSLLHRKLSGLRGSMLAAHEATGWTPLTDVVECDEGLLVRMELAGVDQRKLQARLESGALVVEGERTSPCQAGSHEGLRFRQLEMEYGPFRRVVPLPFPVAGERAEARLKRGVLEVFFPRAEQACGPMKVTVVMGS